MVVVGSINRDVAAQVPHIPGPGETVLATAARTSPGGKGANQAVAAARAGGARTLFVGAVGDDSHAEPLREALVSAQVDVTALTTSPGDSGQALISVDEQSENAIVVAPGANGRFTELQQTHVAAIAQADVLLAQLEIPLPTVLAAARQRPPGCLFVLNDAPAQVLPPTLLAEVDVLVVNEHEALQVAGESELERALEVLISQVPAVLVTLGGAGSRLLRRDGTPVHQGVHSVEAVDTTAAGDTFCGVLAAAWSQSLPDPQTLERAAAAAALAVTRRGAQESVPSRQEVDALVASFSSPRSSGAGGRFAP